MPGGSNFDTYMSSTLGGTSTGSSSSSSSSSSSGGYIGSTNEIKDKIKSNVKKKLGLTTVPNTPPPGTTWSGMDSSTSTFASNLTGKDKWYYGQEASEYTNKELVKAGLATYNPDTGGYLLSSEAWKMKYGSYTPGQAQTGSAMGTGDPEGILTSIQISNKMLQSQNKLKGAILGIAGIAAGGNPAGLIMRGVGAKSLADAYARPGAAYDTYTKQFKAKQSGQKFTQTRNLFGLLGLTHEKKTKKDTLGS